MMSYAWRLRSIPGLSKEDIPWMAENCMKVSAASIQNNPVVFTQEEIAEIYRKAM